MKLPVTIEPRPYFLKNRIQHYAWGQKGRDAFIPDLLGIPAGKNRPFAELWMGAHPGAPSEVLFEKTSVPLDQLIARFPNEILGQPVRKKFGDNLPFLLKVLSAGESLSIQAHPSKTQAVMLHQRDPDHYPDNNHKPELAIALDSFTALVGFKSFPELLSIFDHYPELEQYIGKKYIRRFKELQRSSKIKRRELLEELFFVFLQKSLSAEKELNEVIDRLYSRLRKKNNILSEIEQIFLDLRNKYLHADVGLFFIFFLNLIHLKQGEGIFLEAGIPHAYLGGNIVECMASSDNVVRVGLTPKFKDVHSLIEILQYDVKPVDILRGDPEQGEIIYVTPVQDFQVRRLRLRAGNEYRVIANDSPVILLVTNGRISVIRADNSDESLFVKKGESVLIPALLNQYKLIATEDAVVFKAGVCC